MTPTPPGHLDRAEWVLANALGGFALGSAGGRDERRYHALLVASTRPPVGRVVTLKSIADTLVLPSPGAPDRRIPLTDFAFTAGPARSSPLTPTFERDADFCRWIWHDPESGTRVTRELVLGEGCNAARLTYRLDHAPPGVTLELRPLVALRDFHWLLREHDDPHRFRIEHPSPTRLHVHAHALTLHLDAPEARVHPDPQWWRNFEYARDRERGQEHVEDLFSPGLITFTPTVTSITVTLLAWMGEQPPADLGREARAQRLAHTHALLAPRVPAAHAAALAPLLRAADQFVVRRRAAEGHTPAWLSSIIAGFPWFGDWGRDTCISLRGLLLATARFPEALESLRAFAQRLRRGLIPNCFDDGSGEPEYNTVDAPLWFVLAACDYRSASGDHESFRTHLRDACHQVIDAYRRGTDYHIRMDADALITAGDEATQLTWMDARRDGVVFTPRHGKAVEINALWHATLHALADADPAHADDLRSLAAHVRTAFDAFWNERDACLYDTLTPDGNTFRPVAEIRPNQIFAVALPHSPLSIERQRAVVARVRSTLLTDRGLRTLDPADRAYQPRFKGSLFERDRAYHNGTVWPWLLGPYAEALLRVGRFSDDARLEAQRVLAPLLDLVVARAAGEPIATLAEVYDADAPRLPEGCPAQAWSVAELLRVLLLTWGPPPSNA